MTERTKSERKSCYAIMGTLTNAQKAQKALSMAAIPSNVSKTNSPATHNGCVWSLNFSCNQLGNIKSVLSKAGITVKSWEGDF